MPARDDALGIRVAREFQQMSLPEGVEVVEAETPGLSLLSILNGAERVIIVDAVLSGLEAPGTIHRFKGEHLPPKSNFPLNDHDIHWVEALQMALMVEPEKVPREILVFGIEIEKMAPGLTGLSESAEKAIPELIRKIMKELS